VPVADCLLLIACCLLPIAHCLSLLHIAYCLLIYPARGRWQVFSYSLFHIPHYLSLLPIGYCLLYDRCLLWYSIFDTAVLSGSMIIIVWSTGLKYATHVQRSLHQMLFSMQPTKCCPFELLSCHVCPLSSWMASSVISFTRRKVGDLTPGYL